MTTPTEAISRLYRWSDLPKLAGLSLLYMLLAVWTSDNLSIDGAVSVFWLPSGVALAGLFCMALTAANVELKRGQGQVEVFIGGKHFTTYYFSAAVAKPYLMPLRTPSGVVVTRGFPVAKRGLVVRGSAPAAGCLGPSATRHGAAGRRRENSRRDTGSGRVCARGRGAGIAVLPAEHSKAADRGPRPHGDGAGIHLVRQPGRDRRGTARLSGPSNAADAELVRAGAISGGVFGSLQAGDRSGVPGAG